MFSNNVSDHCETPPPTHVPLSQSTNKELVYSSLLVVTAYTLYTKEAFEMEGSYDFTGAGGTQESEPGKAVYIVAENHLKMMNKADPDYFLSPVKPLKHHGRILDEWALLASVSSITCRRESLGRRTMQDTWKSYPNRPDMLV